MPATVANILLGNHDPLKLERKILEALTAPSGPDLNLAMCIVADSNDEELGAKFLMAASVESVQMDGLPITQAARQIFQTEWDFISRFSDLPNSEIPRRFFGGMVLGILRMMYCINVYEYLTQIIMAPKTPPFMYVTTGTPEAEISRLVRSWAVDHVGQAKQVLTEVRRRMREEWKYPEPTPLGQVVAQAMIYSLFARKPFVDKIELALFM